VRLTETVKDEELGNAAGVLEISHHGAWGTVCSSENQATRALGRDEEPVQHFTQVCCVLTATVLPSSQNAGSNRFCSTRNECMTSGLVQSSAGVACRELGYGSGFAEFRERNLTSTSPAWLDQLQCDGTEASVRECEGSVFGDTWRCGRKREGTNTQYAMLYCASGGTATIRACSYPRASARKFRTV
jgi:hypothetical protein